jgi:hypothetical protein
MTVEEGQRQARTIYLGGAPGQFVCAAIWLASAVAGTWASPRLAVLTLVIGGMFIFPLTQLVLRLMGRPVSLPAGSPFRWLAMEVAFIVPLSLPVILALTAHAASWFYPSCMIVVGAHYLPFHFMYGQRRWLVLAGFLLAAGAGIGYTPSSFFTLGAWVTVLAFLVFATWAGVNARRAEPALS